MNILLIIPGSGDRFYCGNCFRDYLYVEALRRAGHEAVVMPLYLPFTDKSFDANTPLFFPATSYYVAQKFFPKGNIPKCLEKLLDFPSVLRIASSFSGATSAKGMETMTLSMIKGDDVNFLKQAEKMVDWIVHHRRPDVIHLSSSLLIGMAQAIKTRINIPVVCSLQDEEIWIESLESRYAHQAWASIREHLHHINKFVVSSEFYRLTALQKMPDIAPIEVVYPGVDSGKYASSNDPQHPVIGFFYRMNYENGLDILAQAFVALKKEESIPNLKLKIGGGYTRENAKLLHRVRHLLKPYAQDVIWSEPYSLAQHADFYKEISVICAPLRFNESVGLYVCESFAAGRPAVAPHTGSFSETVANAGALYAPNTPDALANAIKQLLTDGARYKQCCQNALHLSQTRYNQTTLASRLQEIYEGCL